MKYVGLDVHKKVVEAAVLDDGGSLLARARFACTREALQAFASEHADASTRVALEATTNTWAVARVLEPLVAEVVISNPMRTRAIAEAKIKTDKVDALVLAQLLRCDYLPRVWIPDALAQRRRHLTSRRAALVSDRTRMKNRIHSVLHQRMIAVPMRDLFSKAGRAWLASLELDELGRSALDSDSRLLAAIEAELERIDLELAKEAYNEAQAKLLMTLPGVDVAVALSLIAALGDITRFSSGDKAAAYLGLVPSVRQSASKCYKGPITKQGRSHARWMMVQAAQHVGRHPGPLGVFFRRLARKKNRNVAVVATARKLVAIAWHMLKNNEPYRYAVPRSTETKLSKLRIKATGIKRKRGSQKGTKRSASYGSGQQKRTIPSIDRVYEREELPPVRPLSDGEKRSIRKAKTVGFVKEIRRERRVPRKANS